jgi:hypothetical protein
VGIVSSEINLEYLTIRKMPTLCKDKVVLLDEALEVVRLQLLDIRCSSNGGKEGRADSRVLHFGEVVCGLELCRGKVS